MQNPEISEQYSRPGSKETPKLSKKVGRSSLNILPTEMKDYLSTLIKQGLGERMIRKAMLQQYPDKTDLIDKSENCYRRYINLQKQNTHVGADSGDAGTFDPSQSVVDLHKFWDERIRTLQAKMATSNDPSLDAALSLAMRMKAQALKMSMEYKESFDQTTEKDFQHEMEQFMMVILAAVQNAYRCINGNNKLTEFHNQLDEFLEGALKYYRVSKSAYVRKDEALCRNCSSPMVV